MYSSRQITFSSNHAASLWSGCLGSWCMVWVLVPKKERRALWRTLVNTQVHTIMDPCGFRLDHVVDCLFQWLTLTRKEGAHLSYLIWWFEMMQLSCFRFRISHVSFLPDGQFSDAIGRKVKHFWSVCRIGIRWVCYTTELWWVRCRLIFAVFSTVCRLWCCICGAVGVCRVEFSVFVHVLKFVYGSYVIVGYLWFNCFKWLFSCDVFVLSGVFDDSLCWIVTLVSPQLRINLSPFTKDFRGEAQHNESELIF